MDQHDESRDRSPHSPTALATPSPALEESLADQAYLLIRERILRGDLPLGAVISRRETARELGISLVPVSEALQRLEVEGLVESRPRAGTRVRVPTEEDILGIYHVREALESQAARLFAVRSTLQERHELRRMARHMDTLFSRTAGDPDPEFTFAVQNFHLQLHMRIAEKARCPILKEAIEKNQVLIFNWIYDTAGRLDTLPPHFHEKLLEVLTAGDDEQADAAMRRHIRYGLERILKTIPLQYGGEWRSRAATKKE